MDEDKEIRFRRLLGEQQDRIYRICCCYFRGEADRQDVLQEVFVQVWRGLDSFEGRSSIETWIHRVTTNSCLAYIRGERRRKRMLDSDADVETLPGASGEDPTDLAHRENEVQALYACINDLPVSDRMLISLHLDDASTREMAEVLGISEVNARVKLHRIRKSLKSALERRNHGSR